MKLGPTQMVLLELLMKNEIVTRYMIADVLKLKDFDCAKHVHYLNEKIKASGALVKNRRGYGYYFDRADRILIESKVLTSRRAA